MEWFRKHDYVLSHLERFDFFCQDQSNMGLGLDRAVSLQPVDQVLYIQQRHPFPPQPHPVYFGLYVPHLTSVC